MFIFRSSFILATSVCVITLISRCATVYAAPQLGMRPNLHVYGVDESGTSEVDSILAPSATASVESASTSVLSSVEATETLEAPDPPTDKQTDAQSNAAFATTSGIGVALFVGSVTAALQLL